MTEKRFTTNGYYIYDHFKGDKWLVNEVEAEYIVTQMNNIDTKARERSKALSKLQKENEKLKKQLSDLLYQIGYIGKNNKSCKSCQCFIEDIKYCWMWDMETDENSIVVACDKRKLKEGDVE